MWIYPPGWVARFRSEERRQDDQLNRLAERIYSKVRAGGIVTYPLTAIHRQVVNDHGGTPEWEAMVADLDIAKEPFTW